VVPPEEVADASCPTLTPASAIMATAISQAAVRLRIFFAAWPSIPTFCSARGPSGPRTKYRTNKTTALTPRGRRQNSAELRGARSGPWRLLTGRFEAVERLVCSDLEGGTWGMGERPLLVDGRARSPQETAGGAGGDTTSGVLDA
jgi:hypothetical protein